MTPVACTPSSALRSVTERRLRPRSTSELVDALFELLRLHYVPLLTMTTVGMSPVVALGVLAALFGVAAPEGNDALVGPFIAVMIVGGLVAAVAIALTASAVIVAVSDAYLHDRVDPAAAFRTAWRRLPATAGAYLLMGFAMMIGFLCLIVGAIYASAALFALPAIVLLEERGPFEAASRSSQLSKDRKLAILGAIVLVSIITSVVSGMVQAGATLTLGETAALIAKFVMFVVLFPATSAMPVLLYYDARVRKEGLDIELEAAGLAQASAATTPTVPVAPARG